jgi:hypothetical protein
MKEIEVSGTCNTWKRLEIHTKFSSENLKGGVHLVDIGRNGRVLLKLLLIRWVCELDSYGSGQG